MHIWEGEKCIYFLKDVEIYIMIYIYVRWYVYYITDIVKI